MDGCLNGISAVFIHLNPLRKSIKFSSVFGPFGRSILLKKALRGASSSHIVLALVHSI